MKRLWCWIFHWKHHIYVDGYMDAEMYCKKCEPEVTRRIEMAENQSELEALKTEVENLRYAKTFVEDVPLVVYGEVLHERKRQDEQWGGPEHDDTHEPLDWLGYITHQCQKTKTISHTADNGKWIFGPSEDYRERLIKIAALAIAAVESYDRKQGDRVEVVIQEQSDRISDLEGILRDVIDTMRKCQVQYPPTTFVYDQLEIILQKATKALA